MTNFRASVFETPWYTLWHDGSLYYRDTDQREVASFTHARLSIHLVRPGDYRQAIFRTTDVRSAP